MPFVVDAVDADVETDTQGLRFAELASSDAAEAGDDAIFWFVCVANEMCCQFRSMPNEKKEC